MYPVVGRLWVRQAEEEEISALLPLASSLDPSLEYIPS
jgi:hypothetical protein